MFQFASASVLGRDHVGPGKNNQDAVFILEDGATIIAIVCDGCGSGAHSEIGAKLGARLVAEKVRWASQGAFGEDFDKAARVVPRVIERVRQDVLAQIRLLANSMGGSFSQTVQDYFLFTVVGALITPQLTALFSAGDGVIVLNGDAIDINPKNDRNAPAYIAYDLVDSTLKAEANFTVHPVISTSDLSSLVIGTDGALDLFKNSGRRLPGRTETIGAVSSLWTEERFFKNGDALRRHLTLVNREHTAIDWEKKVVDREHGCLRDDTSLVVVRRVQEV